MNFADGLGREGVMLVEQISIFLENKAGRLAEISRVVAEAGVNIRALSLADTSDFGILRLIVNDNDKAKAALKEYGFTVGKTDVVAVQVEDSPGGLSSVLDILSRGNINVEYMYAFVQHSGEDAVIIFRFDDIDVAVKLLQENNVRVLEGKTLSTL
jgi:hypothetical protein